MRQVFSARLLCALIFFLAATIIPATSVAIEIDMVLVGDPGNLDDVVDSDPVHDGVQTFGAVDDEFRIGTYEVTNAQYAEFLNFKAKDDPNNLYIPIMGRATHGGITRSGDPGNYSYAPRPGMENFPVVYVDWYDAARFVNWLHNGRGDGDTETGTYTMSLGQSAVRNLGARWFLPSEDEWYKAAYYQRPEDGGDVDGYWRYPTKTNDVPGSDEPPGTDAPNPANTANFFEDDELPNGYNDGYAAIGSPTAGDELLLTEAGAYPLAKSYYGTLDMGGNVWEWNEGSFYMGTQRGLWGGSYSNSAAYMGARLRYWANADLADLSVGFRVASVAAIPEPSALSLAALGAVFAAGAVGWRARC